MNELNTKQSVAHECLAMNAFTMYRVELELSLEEVLGLMHVLVNLPISPDLQLTLANKVKIAAGNAFAFGTTKLGYQENKAEPK